MHRDIALAINYSLCAADLRYLANYADCFPSERVKVLGCDAGGLVVHFGRFDGCVREVGSQLRSEVALELGDANFGVEWVFGGVRGEIKVVWQFLGIKTPTSSTFISERYLT